MSIVASTRVATWRLEVRAREVRARQSAGPCPSRRTAATPGIDTGSRRSPNRVNEVVLPEDAVAAARHQEGDGDRRVVLPEIEVVALDVRDPELVLPEAVERFVLRRPRLPHVRGLLALHGRGLERPLRLGDDRRARAVERRGRCRSSRRRARTSAAGLNPQPRRPTAVALHRAAAALLRRGGETRRARRTRGPSRTTRGRWCRCRRRRGGSRRRRRARPPAARGCRAWSSRWRKPMPQRPGGRARDHARRASPRARRGENGGM